MVYNQQICCSLMRGAASNFHITNQCFVRKFNFIRMRKCRNNMVSAIKVMYLDQNISVKIDKQNIYLVNFRL